MPTKELREAYQNRTVRPPVRPHVTNRVSEITNFTEANLMKFHRKIKLNEKVCRAQELSP